MNKFKKYTYILGLLALSVLTSCSDPDDELTSVDYATLFSPTNFEARVVNQTGLRLNWTAVNGATSYEVEVYETAIGEDNPTQTIPGIISADLPYIISGLAGETDYTVRVKAISENAPASKWSSLPITTEAEQIMTAIQPADINLDATELAYSITLHWTAGEVATKIALTPGDIEYAITADNIAKGEATIDGLDGDTDYTITMYNNDKKRGTLTFTSPVDLNTAIIIKPGGSDLATEVSSAASGAVFAIFPGEYTISTLNVKTSIAIKGVLPGDKPVLKKTITRISAGAGLELNNLILDGTSPSSGDQAVLYDADGTYEALIIKDCEIKNYTKGALYGSKKSNIASVSITNCIFSNIECNGGDLFDFRSTITPSFTFTDNTVYNSALARDGFRMDDGGSTEFPSVKSIITISNNTFDKVCNGNNRRILYIRLKGNNEITFNKNIISNSLGYYTNQANTKIAEMANNNYFNAPNYTASEQANAQNDKGTYTKLDPGYVDATNGDFTLTNEDLIFGKVGDQKWW